MRLAHVIIIQLQQNATAADSSGGTYSAPLDDRAGFKGADL